jgi:hypothetical protein
MIPDHFRSRLQRIPLKLLLCLCGAVTLIGFDRGGFLPTLWITAWAAYFTVRVARSVKRKVELKQLKHNKA